MTVTANHNMKDQQSSSNAFTIPGGQSAQDNVIAAISTDNVIFGLDNGQLKVLLVQQADPRHKQQWALPGGWIRYDENLRDAANRVLFELTGVKNLYLEQLKTFGKVDRFPNDRVITVAYYALVSADKYPLVTNNSGANASWFALDRVPELVYDHNEILTYGLQQLRKEIRHRPIGFELLPEKFTLLALQSVYEAILDTKLDKGNFRRKILKSGLLEQCAERQAGVNHRAANFYTFAASRYQELLMQGFSFVI